MILPDVNVLVYAFRQDVVQHGLSRSWLTDVIEGDARFGVSPLALAAVIRVTTDRRIFPNPTPLHEAFAFCSNLLAQPHRQVVEPGERHWEIFERLCVDSRIAGGRTTDAWYAALAIEWDCEWITFDRDFGRFPGLRWRTPKP